MGKITIDLAEKLTNSPGLVVAFLWHLGSLCKGASALALLRLLRWLLYLAHAVAAQAEWWMP